MAEYVDIPVRLDEEYVGLTVVVEGQVAVITMYNTNSNLFEVTTESGGGLNRSIRHINNTPFRVVDEPTDGGLLATKVLELKKAHDTQVDVPVAETADKGKSRTGALGGDEFTSTANAPA